MILREGHRIDIKSIHKAHEREFRTGQKLLHDHLALAELVVKKHVLECLLRLLESLRDNHTLSCCKSVILQNDREGALLHILQSGIIVLECCKIRCRNIIFRHQLLRKILACLDCRSSLRRSEYSQTRLLEGIHDTCSQSHLRAHHSEVYTVLKGKILELLHLCLLQRKTLRLQGNAGISGSTIDLSYLRTAAESIHNRMFTATAAQYQYFLHVFIVYIYSAKEYEYPSSLSHSPRVKSGISTGMLPFSSESLDRSLMQHHSAMSYTSISSGRPLCRQYISL